MSEKRKMSFGVTVAIVSLLALVCFSLVLAKDISYFPRPEKVDYKPQSYSPARVLSGLSCSGADDLSRYVNRSGICIGLKQGSCPDCCLNINTSNLSATKKCSAQADSSRYDCTASNGNSCANPNPVFYSDSCGAATDVNNILESNCRYTSAGNPDLSRPSDLPHTQKLGCVTGIPRLTGHHNGLCVEDPDDSSTWICNRDDLDQPERNGNCDPSTTNCDDCADLNGQLYELSDIACPTGQGFHPGDTCTKYTPTAALTTCISHCQDYCDSWEKYHKNVYCCKWKACCKNRGDTSSSANGMPDCTSAEVGYVARCNDTKCDERVDWPECVSTHPDYSLPNNRSLCCNSPTIVQDNLEWNKQLFDCLQGHDVVGGTGACNNCYQEIDQAFHYDFVAKSREKLTVVWQIEATPKANQTSGPPVIPTTFFYTMVKIVDPSTNTVVHTSIAHQKAFSGAFSIYAATSSGDIVFVPGRKYEVRLYYFLPILPGYNLQSEVRRLELIVFRVRE